ncbi:hypothetical protein [Nocardioides sp.]|uniref:hypothetical protein n=1 Tax=Nocardioides sp. TaxID=35761 RepID=UPI0035276DA0
MTFLDNLPPGHVADAVAEATGRSHRPDPALPRTGGPAGNAVLTAWTGLVILVLGVAELLTLFDVRGLVSWHVALGALLVPPALLKTATTGWRMLRYYSRSAPYVEAGPPAMLLRVLGPLVVVSTLGLLASGIWLVVDGEESARQQLFSLGGFRADWITVHQGFFAVWCVATGLHLLGRIIPALRQTVVRGGVPHPAGTTVRVALVVTALVAAAALAVVLVRADTGWTHEDFRHFLPPPRP